MAQTTAPLVWDFYREVPDAEGLGSCLEYYDEKAQSLYLADGLKTRTATVEDGHWSESTLGTEIELLDDTPTLTEWEHPATGQLWGVGIDGNQLLIYRYIYAKDIGELVKSGTWKTRNDSQVAQASLTLKNPSEGVVLGEASLFEPGMKLELSVAMGDSELYPIGVAFLDDVDFDAHSATVPLSGRNNIGYRLNQQTFDNDVSFTGNGHDVVAWILGLGGITDYAIGPSDYSQTWTFEPNDTLYKGLQKVFEFFAPWSMLELPDGKIVVGYPAFLAQYQANSVYQFHGGHDVIRRKTKKAADAAYSKVRVTGKAADGTELTPVLLPVSTYSHWQLGSRKTKHVKAADGLSQQELQAYAEQLAASLGNIGIGENMTGPMRPWLLVGDVASISWDGQTSTDLGLINSITHSFGDSGFFTDFAVDSGGIVQTNRSAVAVTASAAVNGYNRHQDLADLIGVIGSGHDGKDGAKGEDGDPGEPGAAAGFGTPTATVDANTGTPSVQITASGPDTAKVFDFAFHNLKGAQGATGPNEISSSTASSLSGVLKAGSGFVGTIPVDSAPNSSHTANLISSAAVANAVADVKGLAQSEAIPSNADLNDYTTPGVYSCGSATTAATLSNCPSAASPFTLTVTDKMVSGASPQRVIQLFVSGNRIFARGLLSTGWSQWVDYYTISGNTPTTLSGVLSGNGSTVSAMLVDSVPTAGSQNLVTSGGVQSALARPNLLDNWFFAGGGSQLGEGIFPINERGLTSYSRAYCIDRWRTVDSSSSGVTIAVQADGVKITHTTTTRNWLLYQNCLVPDPVGKTFTASILVKEVSGTGSRLHIAFVNASGTQISAPASSNINAAGLYQITAVAPANTAKLQIGLYPGSAPTVGDYVVLAAAKLELGDTQTLAHQESGEWVLNELPNYEEQLIRCKSSTADTYDTYANDPVVFEGELQTWEAQLYDYETSLSQTVTASYWYKIGRLCVAWGFGFPTITITTMLQIRNLPFSGVIGGGIYLPGYTGEGGSTTVQRNGNGRMYFRPNITGTINAATSASFWVIGYS